jgi:hypothetical protein
MGQTAWPRSRSAVQLVPFQTQSEWNIEPCSPSLAVKATTRPCDPSHVADETRHPPHDWGDENEQAWMEHLHQKMGIDRIVSKKVECHHCPRHYVSKDCLRYHHHSLKADGSMKLVESKTLVYRALDAEAQQTGTLKNSDRSVWHLR